MIKWIIAVGSVILDVVVFFVGAFFVLGGIWQFPYGTRIGVMLAPFMILLSGSILLVGIIIGRRVLAFLRETKKGSF